MKSLGLCAVLCLCGALALPPEAQARGTRRCSQSAVTDNREQARGTRRCSQSAVTDNRDFNPGYVDCQSFSVGKLGSGDDLDVLEKSFPSFGSRWEAVGYSTDPENLNPFKTDPDPIGQKSGTLQFKELRRDLFAIGLQAEVEVVGEDGERKLRPEFLFYLFDYRPTGRSPAGTQSIAFDTLGITEVPGPDLQVAGLFIPLVANPPPPPPPGNVPEPGSLVLTFAGLCALVIRRRRSEA